MDYRGGTYVSQVQAENLVEACKIWAKNLDVSTIKYVGEKTKSKIVKELMNENFSITPLKDLRNVWFLVVNFNGLAFLNIVRTFSSSQN